MKTIQFILIIIFLLSTPLFSQDRARWRQVFPEHVPPARHSFGMAKLTEGKILIFGGSDKDNQILDDSWIYDYKKQDWIEMPFKYHPEGRYNHKLSKISEGKVILYGGIGENSEFLDTWLFDINKMEWQNLSPKDSCEYRADFAMCQLSEGKVIVFGDELQSSYGTYNFDLFSNNWKLIQYGEKPKPRAGCELSYLDSNLIILYGGIHFDAFQLTELYNYQTRKWTEIIPKTKPKKRDAYGFADLTKNKAIAFGGDTRASDFFPSSQWNNDTWIFDLQDSNWSELKFDVKPEGRYRYSLSNIINNKLILFGGLDQNIRLNDTWIFEFDSLETEVVGINKFTEISIFPNPVNDFLGISNLNDTIFKVEILNIFGENLFEIELQNKNNISVSILPPGFYILKATTPYQFQTVKFVKQ